MPGYKKHRNLVRSGSQWTTVPHCADAHGPISSWVQLSLSLFSLGVCKLLTESYTVGRSFYR